MDARKIALVQESFEKLASLGNETAEVFYNELFAIDASLRPMFMGDMRDQNAKLFAALDFIVGSLHAPYQFLDSVESLARKHVTYGVRPEHYTYVGNALLRTLKKQLGPQFTAELCDAWAEAFKTIAKIMKDAAYVQQRGAA
jgi:hemoglobin-like flavoprotein